MVDAERLDDSSANGDECRARTCAGAYPVVGPAGAVRPLPVAGLVGASPGRSANDPRRSPTIRRMTIGHFVDQLDRDARPVIEKQLGGGLPWLLHFLRWFEAEHNDWESKGAFDSTRLADNADGGPVFQRMYPTYLDYVQDDAFDDGVLSFHVDDFLSQLPALSQAALTPMTAAERAQLHTCGMEALAGRGLQHGFPSIPEATSGLELAKPFTKWLRTEGAPAPTKMNCWEAVLYAAHLTGLKSKSQITDAITRVKSGDLSGGVMGQAVDAAIPRFVRSILRAPAGRVVRPPDASGSVPIDVPAHSLRRGHVVVFGWEGQHVALATVEFSRSIPKRQESVSSARRVIRFWNWTRRQTVLWHRLLRM